MENVEQRLHQIAVDIGDSYPDEAAELADIAKLATSGKVSYSKIDAVLTKRFGWPWNPTIQKLYADICDLFDIKTNAVSREPEMLKLIKHRFDVGSWSSEDLAWLYSRVNLFDHSCKLLGEKRTRFAEIEDICERSAGENADLDADEALAQIWAIARWAMFAAYAEMARLVEVDPAMKAE